MEEGSAEPLLSQHQLKWKLLTGRGSTDTILRNLKILVSFKLDFQEYLHVPFSCELEYYAGVSGSYISGCLWKSWPHQIVLEGAYGVSGPNYCTKQGQLMRSN